MKLKQKEQLTLADPQDTHRLHSCASAELPPLADNPQAEEGSGGGCVREDGSMREV